jgi:hypothetical protein
VGTNLTAGGPQRETAGGGLSPKGAAVRRGGGGRLERMADAPVTGGRNGSDAGGACPLPILIHGGGPARRLCATRCWRGGCGNISIVRRVELVVLRRLSGGAFA